MKYLLSTLFCFCVGITHAQKEITYAAVVENGWWKVIDDKGNILADSLCPRSDKWPVIFEGLFEFRREGKIGFKNYRNEVVVPAVYDNIGQTFYNGCISISKDGKRGLLNKKGKLLEKSFGSDFISEADGNGVVIVRRGDSLALIDVEDNFILSFYYKVDTRLFSEPNFENGLMRVLVKSHANESKLTDLVLGKYANWKVGFINAKGRLVIDTIFSVQEVLAPVRCEGCHATPSYDRREPGETSYRVEGSYYRFVNNRCLVRRNRASYVINARGDSLYAVNARDLLNLNGFVLEYYNDFANKHILSCIIDTNGKTIFSFPLQQNVIDQSTRRDHYMRCHTFQNGYFNIEVINGKETYYQLLDETGKFLKKGQDAPFADAFFFGQDSIAVATGKKSRKGYIRRDMKWMIKPQFTEAGRFSEGLAAVKKSGEHFGYIDIRGDWVIPPQFDVAQPFNNGYAVVKLKNGKYSYINEKGEVMIMPEKYETHTPFYTLKIP